MLSLLMTTGSQPNALNVSATSCPAGTRIFSPARSAGDVIRLCDVISRIPLSNAPTRKPWMPFAAISSIRYAPSGPSIARCASAAVRNANGTCCTSATGMMVPRMPPINVKNSISPATSALSAAGSLPWMLLFCANTLPETRPPLSFSIASHICASRMCSELAGV